MTDPIASAMSNDMVSRAACPAKFLNGEGRLGVAGGYSALFWGKICFSFGV